MASLRTRVARRFLGILLISAFLPIGTLAVLSYTRVASQLDVQARERLRQASKAAGMATLGRLNTLNDELRALAIRVRAAPLGRPIAAGPDGPTRLRAVTLARPGAPPVALTGEVFEPPPLPPGGADYLQTGGTILVVRDGPMILLGRAVDPLESRRGTVWAELTPATLWNSEDVLSVVPPDARLCAFQESNVPLYCDSPVPIPATALQQIARRAAATDAGELEWTSDGESYLAAHWSLFLRSHFLAPSWTFVVSESKASALASMHDFKRTFPLAMLLSLWVVLLLGVTQIRKTTAPLLELQAGTRRIALRDFTTPVAVTSGDEFEDLAGSFNGMANRLDQQFQEGERLTAALRRAGASLQESETRLRTILETAADGVITVDEQGLIESFNRAAERIFGYTSEQVIQRPVTLLLAEQTPGAGDALAAFRLAGGRGEVLGRRQDGTTLPMEFAVSEARLGDRSIFTGFTRDTSARKQAEQERAALEKQLWQAQKLETIGTLAGGIAHDFNNILTAIMGYLDLALAEIPADHPVQADLKEVQTAALRARDLVRQILVFSRGTEPERHPLDLGLLVQEALKLLRASLPTTIEIRHTDDPTMPAVLADSTQMHQVVMNLCTNAYHAMRETGGVLDVALDLVEVGVKISGATPNLPAGPYVRLRVRDTGRGMDRATLDHIFEPFFTTKPVGEGTGLGLSVVHGIVTSHGGAITVESEPGKGSTFSVFLPVVAAEAAGVVVADVAEPTGHERILIVDDDPAIARVSERALTRWGYQVTACTASQDGLERFRASPTAFDLIVTDYTMPGMTGVQLTRELLQVRPDVPVILVTGLGEKMTEEQRRALGFRACLTKPLSIRELGAAVRRVLDHTEE